MPTLQVAMLELIIARRNRWVAAAVALMAVFCAVLTLAGGASAGALGAAPLLVAVTSVATLSVYLIPLIALLLSYDAIAGEAERGTLALGLTYPLSRGEILAGKFIAHLCVLSAAVAAGLGLMMALVAWRHGAAEMWAPPVLRLFWSSLALGAAFLGMGYLISALTRQPSAASAAAIVVWLTGVVLYDLGLLGALVADDGGRFTKSVFPWLLIANPADSFRLLNLPEASSGAPLPGLSAAKPVSTAGGQLASLLIWPAASLLAAYLAFRRVEG